MANNEKLQLALEKDLELVKKTADAALPSADLTQTKILELIGNLPIKNGGTGAGTKKEAFDNLAFLGLNPISSLEEDTPQKWLELGSGYAKFDINELMNNQPEQYMFVINFSHESSAIFQIGSLQSGNGVYYRTGNSNGWTVNWTPLLGANSIIPIANGGTGANIADTARENLNAQRRIPAYISGEGTDLDTEAFDFVLTTLTAEKHQSLRNLGFGSFAFVWQFFYQRTDNTTGRTQIAKSYLNNKFASRFYNSSTKSWSPWEVFFTSSDNVLELGLNRTSGGSISIDFHTNVNTDYDTRISANTSKAMALIAPGGVSVSNVASGNGFVRNIQFSNKDLTAGSSALSNGQIYLVYE